MHCLASSFPPACTVHLCGLDGRQGSVSVRPPIFAQAAFVGVLVSARKASKVSTNSKAAVPAATVFAYGQSGSGKTHTMTGGPSEENAGVHPAYP